MEPGAIYMLALVGTALFVAPFNTIARVIVLGWMIGHVGWMLGMAEPWANILGQSCVLFAGIRHVRRWPCVTAWGLSLPLILFNIAWLSGFSEPWAAWWAVFWMASVQLAVLPLGITPTEIRSVLRAWRETTGRGIFRMGAAQ